MSSAVRIYDMCEPQIKIIQDWFNKAYGFFPSKKQIVLFALHTVRDIDVDIHKYVYKRTTLSLPYQAVTLPKESVELLKKLIMTYQNSFAPDMGTLVTSLVMTSALLLPNLGTERGGNTFSSYKVSTPKERMKTVSATFQEIVDGVQ